MGQLVYMDEVKKDMESDAAVDRYIKTTEMLNSIKLDPSVILDSPDGTVMRFLPNSDEVVYTLAAALADVFNLLNDTQVERSDLKAMDLIDKTFIYIGEKLELSPRDEVFVWYPPEEWPKS